MCKLWEASRNEVGFISVRCRLRMCSHGGDCDYDDNHKMTILKRHDRVCAQLHFNICKEIGVQLEKEHWCEHVQ
jgi:hypothetical protein